MFGGCHCQDPVLPLCLAERPRPRTGLRPHSGQSAIVPDASAADHRSLPQHAGESADPGGLGGAGAGSGASHVAEFSISFDRF